MKTLTCSRQLNAKLQVNTKSTEIMNLEVNLHTEHQQWNRDGKEKIHNVCNILQGININGLINVCLRYLQDVKNLAALES